MQSGEGAASIWNKHILSRTWKPSRLTTIDRGRRPQRVQNGPVHAVHSHVDPMRPELQQRRMHVRTAYPRLHGPRPGAARRATGFPCPPQYVRVQQAAVASEVLIEDSGLMPGRSAAELAGVEQWPGRAVCGCRPK